LSRPHRACCELLRAGAATGRSPRPTRASRPRRGRARPTGPRTPARQTRSAARATTGTGAARGGRSGGDGRNGARRGSRRRRATGTQAAPPPTANENLAHFYDTLGEKRHAEQQVKQLFDIAAKTGLALDQGDYKFSVDKGSRVAAYQVTLPVKGAYQNIWQFSLQALTAIPFASLDDIAFRRETISEPVVEARLRFTLYLKEKP